MKDDLKKYAPGAAALAAGVGSYALMRRPGGLIRKAFGKDLEPIVAKNPHERAGKIERLAWSPYAKTEAKISGPKGVKDQYKGIDQEKNVFMGHRQFTSPQIRPIDTKIKRMHDFYDVEEQMPSVLTDKYLHAKAMGKYGPKSYSIAPSEAKKLKRLKPAEVRSYFDQKYGKDKYILKSRHGEEDIGATTGKRGLVHSGSGKKWEKVRSAGAERYVASKKLDILKEFRVTGVGDKLVSIQDRYPGEIKTRIGRALGIIPKGRSGVDPFVKSKLFNKKLHEDMGKLLRHHNKKTGLLKKSKLPILNMDVALVKNPNGTTSYKIIEPNVGSSGGQMDNPLVSHKMYKLLTGKESKPMAAIKATGYGSLAGGATYAGENVYDKSREN